MTSAHIDKLLKLIGTARDGALLRFSLGNEYLKLDDLEHAAASLRAAVQMEPAYSAAWKLLGMTLDRSGRPEQALEAYRQGIAVAEGRGDRQAAKEMAVFARRLAKSLASNEGPGTGP
jgi:Flp pilus assembly protein TadD